MDTAFVHAGCTDPACTFCAHLRKAFPPGFSPTAPNAKGTLSEILRLLALQKVSEDQRHLHETARRLLQAMVRDTTRDDVARSVKLAYTFAEVYEAEKDRRLSEAAAEFIMNETHQPPTS